MAIAPEPGKTKCPTCSNAMVPVGLTKEEGQTVLYLHCPECGHQLEVPLRVILRSGTSLADPKASFSTQRRETGRRQLWTGSSTAWDIESRRNRNAG